MQIKYCVSAVNDNPKYTRFVPIFIKAWKKFYPNIRPLILYIGDGDHLPSHLQQFSEFIKIFKPIPHISTALIAQTIRILWPALLPNDGAVVITDIDIIPMNNRYFVDPLFNISNNCFVNMRSKHIQPPNQIVICYSVAMPAIWSKIFNIHNEEDIYSFLISNNVSYDNTHGGIGWYTDQQTLYKYVHASQDINIIYLDDTYTHFKRLDHWDTDKLVHTLLTDTSYTDFHFWANYSTVSDKDCIGIVHQAFG